MKVEYILIYITFASEKLAREASEQLINQRLVACANIFPPIKSVYNWQGKIVAEEEVVVLFKTIDAHYAEVTKIIIESHSYESPCIIKLPILDGEPKFLKWIQQEVK